MGDNRTIADLTIEELEFVSNWLDLLGAASPVLIIAVREFRTQIRNTINARSKLERAQPESDLPF